MCPSRWSLSFLLMVLCCVHVADGNLYTQLYNGRWGRRGVDRMQPSTHAPRASDPPPAGSTSRASGAVSRGQYYNRLLGRVRGNQASPKRGAFSRPSLLPQSSTDVPTTSEIIAMIPPGGTIDDLPKRLRAILTGDPDYTRFRQLFLREMCQRLLNGPRSELFPVCLSIRGP